jgi:hypothetical protein
MERLEAMRAKAVKWLEFKVDLYAPRWKVAKYALACAEYLKDADSVLLELEKRREMHAWLGQPVKAKAYELFMRPFKKKEVCVCCGCRDGWCEGCIPDETLLNN